jgi:hypothetical protein
MAMDSVGEIMRSAYLVAGLILLGCTGAGRQALEKDSFAGTDGTSSLDAREETSAGKPDLDATDLGPDRVGDGGCPNCTDIPADGPSAEDCPGCADVPPTDLEPDLPVLPQGCCWTDEDCPPDDSGQPMVCAGQNLGWPDGAGVCVGPPELPGWCYSDSQCAVGQECHGAAVCGCQTDCDMDYEGPGVCVPESPGCVPIEESWVKEWCNAASIVIWDGEKCVETCPGCCECKPFCEFTFATMGECLQACKPDTCIVWDGGCDDALPEYPWWFFDGKQCQQNDSCVCAGCPGVYLSKEACEAACGLPSPECPTYVTALAEGPFALKHVPGACPEALPMAGSCKSDSDCPTTYPDGGTGGGLCVLGNCVDCWNDTHCGGGMSCRGGRCVPEAGQDCFPVPCEQDGCHLVTPSENPCPVCLCETPYAIECSEDSFCSIFSFHPFQRCVFGRCADCRNDDDCPSLWGYGDTCLPPGICYDMTPPPFTLFGTWLVGWPGGLNHLSYLRFEADGMLRRGAYVSDGIWVDDFPSLPCVPDGVLPMPLLGTWEPEITQSGFLVVRVNLNVSCDPGAGFTARWAIVPGDEGEDAQFKDIDTGWDYMGTKIDNDNCLPDMSLCDTPTWPL